jgi:hypothetical protein
MPKYQIRFCDSKGNGYFEYVDVKSKKGVEQIAAAKATDSINRVKQTSRGGIFGQQYKSKRTVHVWEMDMITKQPKKDGHRFKLSLASVTASYTDGSKSRKEWYEPVIEIKSVK